MEYEEFGRKVKQAFEDSKRRYGAVKLCRVLNGAGTPCSIKRVQRHMAEQGLRSVVVRKYLTIFQAITYNILDAPMDAVLK